MIYILEGQLPIDLIIRGEMRSFKAPHICITNDSYTFIEYEHAPPIRGMVPEERMCLHTIYFHIEYQRAFESISKTFTSSGYFRAAIYLTEIYLEIRNKLKNLDGYGYIGKNSCYWWDPVRFCWRSIAYGKLSPARIHAHYSEMRKQGRLAL